MPNTRESINDIYHKLTGINGRAGAAAAADTLTRNITSYADSPLVISGGELSNGTNAGTIKITTISALVRESDSNIAPLVVISLAGQDNIAIPAANIRYHIVLTSTPAIVIQVANANGTTEIGIGTVMKEADDTVHYCSCGMRIQNGVAKAQRRAASLRYIELASGCVITETGGALTLGISAGIVYEGLNRFTPFSGGAFDSNVADTFTRVYRDGGGGYTQLAGQTVIDSDHYDDGNPPLGNVLANQYSVHFVYLHPDDEHIYVLYGRDTFKLAEAIEEQPYGDLPIYLANFAVLLGKIITKNGTAIFDNVQMVTDTFFTGSGAVDHANLGGLQGGQLTEYYHLTATEHGYISGVNAQSLLTTASPSFVNITDTGVEATNLAAGTIGQRPGGVVGDIRYNSTLGVFEVYTGVWQNVLTGVVGIADNNILSVDGVAAANDYAKFTASGLVGRSYDEVLADLSAQALAAFDWNDQALTSIGATELYGDIKTDRWLFQNSNTFIGVNICGAGNLAHGAGSEGYYNTGVGYNVFRDITTGYRNVGIGHQSLMNNEDGWDNMAVGFQALHKNTSGSENMAIGIDALYSNTSGTRNVAIGPYAAFSNTTGYYNVGIGFRSLFLNTTSYHNVGIGSSSLYNTKPTGAFEAVGNIGVGYRAGDNITTGSQNVIIGYDVNAPSATGNYQMNIGDFLHGITDKHNLGLNTYTWGANADTVLAIKNGTPPDAAVADEIQIYSKDSSDGAANATLALMLEQTIEVIGTFTPSHKIKVWINAVEYWLQLDAV